MIEAALADNPPHQLLLGNPAIDRMKQELEAQMAELVAWEALGRGTDFE